MFFDAINAIVKKIMDSKHVQNHDKAQQAHMKKMTWNKNAFTPRFRTAKRVWTRFFFFFFSVLGHRHLWPQNQKKVSPDPFHANMAQKVYTAKISGPYQLFLGLDPFFSVV